MVCPFVYIWSSVVCLLQGIQMTTRRRLCTIKGISEAKMEKIKEAATKLCVHFVLLFKICRLVTSQAFLFKNKRLEKCVWNYISSLFYTPVLDKIVLCFFFFLSPSLFFFFFLKFWSETANDYFTWKKEFLSKYCTLSCHWKAFIFNCLYVLILFQNKTINFVSDFFRYWVAGILF